LALANLGANISSSASSNENKGKGEMKVIRSKGYSFTVLASENAQSLQRKLTVTRKGAAPVMGSLGDYAATDPDLLIRQFIAMIDKTLKKPADIRNMALSWYEAREGLANACWELLREKYLICRKPECADLKNECPHVEAWKNTWRWKVHPYAKKDSDAEDRSFVAQNIKHAEDQIAKFRRPHEHRRRRAQEARLRVPKDPDFRGRRYATFWRENDGVADYAATARIIEAHLLSHEVKLCGEPRKIAGGVARSRAESIEKSVPAVTAPVREKSQKWEKADEDHYFRHDVAKEIYEHAVRVEAGETKKNIRGRRPVANEFGECLYRHYATVGLADESETIKGRPRINIRNLHDAVRDFYKRKARGSKRGQAQKNNLHTTLPRNSRDLRRLLHVRQENADMNALIRRGKVIFHARLDADNPTAFDEKLRFYATSEGQARIKRMEAFSRVWRNTLSQASRTAHSWADPHNKGFEEQQKKQKELGREDALRKEGNRNEDIFSGGVVNWVCGDGFDEKAFVDKATLLFGSKSALFTAGVTDERKNVLRSALMIANNIRLRCAHFTRRDKFVAALQDAIKEIKDSTQADEKSRMSPVTRQKIRELYFSDLCDRDNAMIDDLKGFFLDRYANEGRLKAIVSALRSSDGSDITLPRFARLTGINDNTKAWHEKGAYPDRKGLPATPNAELMTAPSIRVKYGVLKFLYERVFPGWLEAFEKANSPVIKEMYAIALREGAARAQMVHSGSPFKDLIQAKADRLPRFGEAGLDTIAKLFDAWAGEVAIEMRTAAAYESNSEDLRDSAAWIEGFKCALLAMLFVKFLGDMQFDWLLKVEPGATPFDAPTPFPPLEEKSSSGDDKMDQWLCNLYFFLHLAPPMEVAQLLHQFRKAEALEERAAPEGDKDGDGVLDTIEQLRNVFTLYLDMKDAKFTGEAVDVALEPFKEFFEKEEDFKRLYHIGETTIGDAEKAGKEEKPEDRLLANTRRGLREVMRFGHLHVLMQLCENAKISRDEVNRFEEGEGRVAELSSLKSKLHKKWKDGQRGRDKNNALTRDEEAQYKECVGAISAHRALAARVRLTDHVQAHQLVMRVIGRFVDYAALYERDRLFVFLALAEANDNGQRWIVEKLKRRDLLDIADFYGWRESRAQYIEKDGTALFNHTFLPPPAAEGADTPVAVRNDLAHFNILNGDRTLDLTALANRVRLLVGYDRKLKNAVSKSIIEMLARDGVLIRWDIKDHQLANAKIDAKQIKHLAKKGPKERLKSDGYLAMAARAFNGSVCEQQQMRE
jgi:hypothetical protein